MRRAGNLHFLQSSYLLAVGGTKWLRAYAESSDRALSLRLTALLFTNKNEDCDPNIIRDASQTYSLRDLNSRLSLQSSYLLAVGDGSFRLQSRGCGVPNPRLTAKSSFTPTRMRTTTCYTQSRKPAFLATLILVETPYEGQAVRPAPRIP